MPYKLLKLILLSTVFLQASPKAFESLSNELDTFKQNCKAYKNISNLPKKIGKQCNVFNSNLNNAFKVGYALDPHIDSDNLNEEKLNKYLSLLLNLDKNKDDILKLMYAEVRKARDQNNTKYYSELIKDFKIKLYSSDYDFMEKNIDIFKTNKRYLSHIQYMKDIKEQIRLENIPTKKQKDIMMQEKENKDISLPLLDRFDFIVMTSRMKDDLLDIHFFYTDKETDNQVLWNDGEINVSCEAYYNVGPAIYKPVKGYPLGSSSKRITSSGQSLYIEFKQKNFNNGIAECELDVEGQIFNLSSQFTRGRGIINNTINVNKK